MGTERPTAATRVVGVIGDPVEHSLSPVIHNAAFEALGLDWVYLAFRVPRGEATGALGAVRVLGLAGLNITVPHKADTAAACDELTPVAARLRSVNTVVRRDDGSLLGDSTDGQGFLRAIADEGVDPAGRRALVLGAGGAARAVVLALVGAGATVTVAARRREAAEEAAFLGATPAGLDDATELLAGHDLVVNATPLGLRGEPPPFDPGALAGEQVVADLVYRAGGTPLVRAARERGARAFDGVGMLVHQGALAFRLWIGQDAPLDTMRAAAHAAIAPAAPPSTL